MKTHIQYLSKTTNLPIIEEDEIVKEPLVLNKYHLSWASNRGMVWVLLLIMGDQCIVQTPKTKRKLTVKIKDLREINKNIIKNCINRIQKNKKINTK